MLRAIAHELVRYLSFIYPQCRYVMFPHTVDKVHETLTVVCKTSVGQYNKFSTRYIILDPIFVLHALKTVGKIYPSYRMLKSGFPCFKIEHIIQFRYLHHVFTGHMLFILPFVA